MPQSNGSQGTVLIVEDDRNTAALVAKYLEREGFSAVLAHDGGQALRAAGESDPVFVILDVMLPGMDGWEICRTLRKSSDVPILMLTAREEEVDRVAGLAMGADDYVVKPFSPRELVERVKAILRRSRPAAPRPAAVLTFAGLELDPEKRRVVRDGRPVTLTMSEYKILHVLMSSPGKAFSREELLDRCYRHGEAVIDRVIDVHVGKLRQKIEDDPAQPRFILTVRGHGYRFSEDE
jgi:DNA-binding response OmpR family regulator